MTLNADNVRVGIAGGIYFADLGIELPTNAHSAIAEDFTDVGYISEDGITQTLNTTTTNIKAWQDGTVVRTIQTEHTYSLAFAMIEFTLKNLSLYYADPDATKEEIKVMGKQSPLQSVIVDVIDGKYPIRIVVPKGQLTQREDVTYKSDEAIAFGVTLEAFPNDKDVKAYIYSGEAPGKAKASTQLSTKNPAPGDKVTATVKVKNNG